MELRILFAFVPVQFAAFERAPVMWHRKALLHFRRGDGRKLGEKLEATGVIQFMKPKDKDIFIPVLMLQSVNDLVVRKDMPFSEVVDK